MQANGAAWKLIDLHAFWNILHAFCNILHTFWNILHTFWKILQTFLNILHTYWNILHTFWNILHTFCIHSGGTFWNCTLHSTYLECFNKTDRHTYIRTCRAASSQLKRHCCNFIFVPDNQGGFGGLNKINLVAKPVY